MGMGLNFGLPRVAPNIVEPVNSNYYNLQPSQYAGFQQVGNRNVFQKDGQFYEPYTADPVSFTRPFMYGGGTQTWKPSAPYFLNQAPRKDMYTGKYVGGWEETGGPVEGTIYSGSQAFRPYSGGIASLYNAPAATQTTIPSFLSAPTMTQATGNYGANRFLNTGNLLGNHHMVDSNKLGLHQDLILFKKNHQKPCIQINM